MELRRKKTRMYGPGERRRGKALVCFSERVPEKGVGKGHRHERERDTERERQRETEKNMLIHYCSQ